MERDTLIDEISGALNQNDILLVIIPSEEYPDARLAALSAVTDSDATGVYLTVNTPIQKLVETLEEGDVDTGNLFFIDAITRESGGTPEHRENTYFLRSPSDLTNMSIAISEAVASLPGDDRFLIIDSLSTLSIYNAPGAITRFMHEMISRMRDWDVNGMLLTLDDSTDEDVITKVTSFADSVVRV